MMLRSDRFHNVEFLFCIMKNADQIAYIHFLHHKSHHDVI